MNRLNILWIASILLITACAPKPPEVPEQKPLEHNKPATTKEAAVESSEVPPAIKTHAKLISTFEISGAIAAKNHKKGWTASLNWSQTDLNHYQIRLIGPLGGQTVMISKNGAVITYQEGAKKITSTNGDDLLLKQTGIRLPVNNLYYWVRGMPAPGSIQSETHNQTDQLQTLKQAGYTIEYGQYMSVGDRTLPSKIRLEGHDVMIKLVIKHWRI